MLFIFLKSFFFRHDIIIRLDFHFSTASPLDFIFGLIGLVHLAGKRFVLEGRFAILITRLIDVDLPVIVDEPPGIEISLSRALETFSEATFLQSFLKRGHFSSAPTNLLCKLIKNARQCDANA